MEIEEFNLVVELNMDKTEVDLSMNKILAYLPMCYVDSIWYSQHLVIPYAINITHWQICQHFGNNSNKINIVKNNIPHTASKVGVLESIIFSHTPDEAMSVGLAKACVP